MNFVEKPFLYFILVVFGLWWITRRFQFVNQGILLVASLVFYAFHQWELVFLILAYCLVDWIVGLWITNSKQPMMWLSAGVIFNLAGLAFWKYTPMLVRTAAWIALKLDLPEVPPAPENWLLPIGISFYSFTGIAYMVDVYRGDTKAERNPFRFALYISFFPQLVAGPILRANEFLNKLQPGEAPEKPLAPLEAATWIARGFFKKLVLADSIARAIDPFFAHIADGSTAGVWSLPFVYLYAFQIYFDFSGYTDIARGLGLLFGYRWPENFNAPYLANSVQDFWQRWHVTLSRFLRDYLYIPMGGSRGGHWLTVRNLMVTMLLGGLWHGASWTFLLWGGLHGLFLVIHRSWKSPPFGNWMARSPSVIRWAWQGFCVVLTFHAVCLAWCFFRLSVLGQSLVCVQKWFVFDSAKMFVGGSANRSLWLLLGCYAIFGLSARVVARMPQVRGEENGPELSPTFRGFLWGTASALFLLAFVLSPGGEKPPFIYFRF
ncbi:MAG: MBOAT family O-acyltransferase [Gemmataceae bacterium]